jgi:hypothetical protein
MLKPADLAVADYKVALKPLVGYEQQLFVSTQAYTELGTIEVVAPNSGTYTPNVADNLELAAGPQELMVVLNGDVDLLSALTVTVNGLDGTNAVTSDHERGGRQEVQVGPQRGDRLCGSGPAGDPIVWRAVAGRDDQRDVPQDCDEGEPEL